MIANDKDSPLPKSIERTEDLEKTIIKAAKLEMGPRPITEASLNAKPHLYLPWMYKVLQLGLEQKVYVAENVPQNYVSTGYVHRKVQEVCAYNRITAEEPLLTVYSPSKAYKRHTALEKAIPKLEIFRSLCNPKPEDATVIKQL